MYIKELYFQKVTKSGALKEAVRDLIIARRATDDTVVIWKNVRVAWVPAREVVLESEEAFPQQNF